MSSAQLTVSRENEEVLLTDPGSLVSNSSALKRVLVLYYIATGFHAKAQLNGYGPTAGIDCDGLVHSICVEVSSQLARKRNAVFGQWQ